MKTVFENQYIIVQEDEKGYTTVQAKLEEGQLIGRRSVFNNIPIPH